MYKYNCCCVIELAGSSFFMRKRPRLAENPSCGILIYNIEITVLQIRGLVTKISHFKRKLSMYILCRHAILLHE